MPNPNTVELEVPAGMTAEQLKNLVTSYIPKREKSKGRDKAKREAITTLVKTHQADYDRLLAAAKKKRGIS